MPQNKTRVGIFGSSGFTGNELIKIIISHPKLELSFAHSRHYAGKKISDVYSYLGGLTDVVFTGNEPKELSKDVDVIFLALAHGEASAMCELLKDFPGKIIDLTMDHRSSDDFVYGITELCENKLVETNRIANPGCFATSAILAAAPFVKNNVVEGTLYFNSVTGSSGAGMSPAATTHHPFRDENLFAYKLFKHQHEPEIHRQLNEIGKNNYNVILAAHSGPFVRGIHTTLHFAAEKEMTSMELTAIAENFYSKHSFVRVRQNPPTLKDVVGSNFCDLYVTSRGKDVLVITVIDNLVKGAAGQAVQNLNVAMKWNEREGLWNPPNFL